MSRSFTHLHVHTSYSALESTVHIDELLKKCQEYEMESVAMTDHGNLCGAIDFFNSAKKAKIKPIFGCDMYLRYDGTQTGQRTQYSRLVLLSMHTEGFQNLSKLVSRSYLEGKEQRPLINKNWLQESNAGLIALSGGLKGEIAWHLLNGREEAAIQSFHFLRETFGDRFYAELHQNLIAEQKILNEWLMARCKETGTKYVAASDVHYLLKEDAASHEVFVCTQMGRTLMESGSKNLLSEFWFKDPTTMEEQFADYPEALDISNEIAQRCNVSFKFADDKGNPIYYLPAFQIPKGEKAKNADDFLALESKRGLLWRFEQPAFAENIKKPGWEAEKKKYTERLDDEIQMIQKTGFSGYFLIVSDFIRWAKKEGIPVGPGRGSGAGSLVAWALQIIDIDPLPYNLLFERFINPERISLPDFDVDFCQDRRGDVIEYVRQKYGKEQVSQIITFGRMQTKQCIRDVGRVLGMPYGEVDQIAKLVPEQLGISISEALEKEPKFEEMRAANPTIDTLFHHALKLEGLTRSFGKHAGGVIITDKALTNYAPLMADDDGAIIVQYDKDAAEKVGLVKFDFLGLKTLTHIQNAVNLVNESNRKKGIEKVFKIEDVGVYDADAYALISKGDTNGVFQVESSGMSDLCKKLKPANLEELTWINALYRPGPLESGMVDDFIERKHGRIAIEYMLPQLEEVLRESLGVILYQEQVMRAARVLAGYSLGEADLLRRAMGKKKPEEMAKMKDGFIKRAVERSIPEQKANDVFDLIEKFSGYGFNKSHATAYALISFQTAYLKAHYPAEFYAALLTTEMSDTDKLAKYISDAKDHEIPVLGPDINQSSGYFSVVIEDGINKIRFGLQAIKNVGAAAVSAIEEEREKSGPFKSFSEFCRRIAQRKVTKKTIETLIRAGAFDALYKNNTAVNRATLHKAMESVIAWGIKQQEKADTNQAGLFEGLFNSSDGPVLKESEPEMAPQTEWSHAQKLEAERELLGFYVSGHPLDPYKSLLKQCSSLSIGRIFEMAEEGTIPKRSPDDWKNRRKGEANNEPQIGGMITLSKEITTKKGDRMAFLSLEDFGGKIEVVCFPKAYEKYKDAIRPGNVVVVTGQLEATEGKGAKILASAIHSLEVVSQDKMKNIRTVVFRLDANNTSKEQLENLKQICVRYKGNCKGVIEYMEEGGLKARFNLPDALKFSADMGFVQEVKEIFGRDVLSFQ